MALYIMYRTIQDSDAIKRLKTPSAASAASDSLAFSSFESRRG